jgi:hypothetical protein
MNVNELLPLHRIPQPLYDAIENALREAVLHGTTSVVQRQDIIEAAKNYASLVAQQRCAAQEREFAALKMAVEAMMAPLGYHGTISARDDRVQSVMDALARADNVRAPGLNMSRRAENSKEKGKTP